MTTNASAAVMTDYSTLNAVRAVFGARATEIGGLGPDQRTALFQLAEMIVLDERISLDDYLMSKEPDARRVAEELKGIVIPIRVETDVRIAAAVYAVEFGSSYPELDQRLSNLRRTTYPEELDPQLYWAVSQELDLRDLSVETRRKAERLLYSTQPRFLARTVYYYFLSRVLECSYAPFGERNEIYQYILELEREQKTKVDWVDDAATTTEIARTVVGKVERHGKELRERQKELAELSKPLDVPAVIRVIVRHARDRRIPIIEAAVSIRNTEEAKSFRSFVKRYRQALVEQDVSQKNKVQLELDQICEYWASPPGITGRAETKIRIGQILSMEQVLTSRIIRLPKMLRPNKHLIFLHEVWGAATL